MLAVGTHLACLCKHGTMEISNRHIEINFQLSLKEGAVSESGTE